MRNGENLYEIIAGNIRREWKRLSLTQAKLAEWADVSAGIGDFTACSNEPGTAGTVHRAFYFYDESVQRKRNRVRSAYGGAASEGAG